MKLKSSIKPISSAELDKLFSKVNPGFTGSMPQFYLPAIKDDGATKFESNVGLLKAGKNPMPVMFFALVNDQIKKARPAGFAGLN